MTFDKTCPICQQPVVKNGDGRGMTKTYCSRKCQVRARYERDRAAARHPRRAA